MDPEAVIVIDGPGEPAATFTPMVRSMLAVAAALLDDRGCEMPAMRVVASSDLLSAIAREGEALGLGPDRRTGIERVGGALAGKCLQSSDGARATIIVPLEAAMASDGLAVLLVRGSSRTRSLT